MKVIICIGFVFFIYLSECQRRIINGVVPKEDKPFVVYLLQTARAKTNYDAWICGGTLVTNKHIITSAACIEDVQSIYAIAGYKKYVTTKNIFNDECTKRIRNKIIKSCIPKYFELDYDNFTRWVTLDIAVAFVEKPYNFKDPVFTQYCSYAPDVIGINSDKANEFGGAMIYGWGHERVYRKPDQTEDLNVETMRYTPVALVNTSVCTKAYSGAPGMVQVIPNFMICSSGRGGISAGGKRLVDICTRRANDKECIDFLRLIEKLNQRKLKRKRRPIGIAISSQHKRNATFYPQSITRTSNKKSRNVEMVKRRNPTTKSNVRNRMESHRGPIKSVRHYVKPNSTSKKNISMIPRFDEMFYLRRDASNTKSTDYGPCQNDHGGPIASFVGRYEVLLGVQSAFVLDKDYVCHAPFVYTSTASVVDFLNCILFKGTANEKAGIDCSNPIKSGFDYDWHFDTTAR